MSVRAPADTLMSGASVRVKEEASGLDGSSTLSESSTSDASCPISRSDDPLPSCEETRRVKDESVCSPPFAVSIVSPLFTSTYVDALLDAQNPAMHSR